MEAKDGKQKRWPRWEESKRKRLPPRQREWLAERLSLTKCGAGGFAGAVTGLLAGIGVAIALSGAIDSDPGSVERWLEYVCAGLIILFAGAGGGFTGAIASGCYGDSKGAEEKPTP